MSLSIQASALAHIPDWALRQRHLISVMNEAAPLYQQRYTRADGTFIWREEWPGMDGSDDAYESYHNWPLFYALGGSADLHERSRFLWDAITRQFTGYGQVWREFDGYYDWMHHGESSIYFYYFGLADPNRQRDRARALRFASFYMDEELDLTHPELGHVRKHIPGNWDTEKRMIRSPINGSRGSRFETTAADWATHRWVLREYPIPFDDLDIPTQMEPWRRGESVLKADWNDDSVFAVILNAMNERMMRCDVPLNLTSTSLITNAFLYTGDDRYRRWVVDYLESWADRIAANNGLCPDNVGPTGGIGETMGGKWWGGYYGWRWPHGFMTIIEPLTIAAMNATLLTGDMSYLDIPRGQLDYLINLGREEEGRLLVPYRHTDEGWTAWRPMEPKHASQIWYMSQDPRDKARVDALPETRTDWLTVHPGRSKGDDLHFGPWYCYIDGRNPDYPRRILEEQYAEVLRRMDKIRADDGNPEDWDVHHWQNVNPVHTEGLVQLTCGGPQIIYHGGLLHVRLRYFDALERRPGLPADVAALVPALDAESVTVELINTNPSHERRLIVQAGAFGEHDFTSVELGNGETQAVDGKHFEVALPPGRSIRMKMGIARYVNTPSYAQPV
ncbi:MAG: hypothetical protein KF893_24995 [Caldilineaceae bacterium]|nr:hypothetical protein [Caldilineaceae bacterium]